MFHCDYISCPGVFSADGWGEFCEFIKTGGIYRYKVDGLGGALCDFVWESSGKTFKVNFSLHACFFSLTLLKQSSHSNTNKLADCWVRCPVCVLIRLFSESISALLIYSWKGRKYLCRPLLWMCRNEVCLDGKGVKVCHRNVKIKVPDILKNMLDCLSLNLKKVTHQWIITLLVCNTLYNLDRPFNKNRHF